MLPSPTAEPMVARTKPTRPDQVSRCSVMGQVALTPRCRSCAALKKVCCLAAVIEIMGAGALQSAQPEVSAFALGYSHIHARIDDCSMNSPLPLGEEGQGVRGAPRGRVQTEQQLTLRYPGEEWSEKIKNQDVQHS